MNEPDANTGHERSRPRSSRSRLPRRGFLAASVGALSGLAGCSGPFAADDSPDYDVSALRSAIDDRRAPERPTAFPGSVPADAWQRHEERARELLAAVPSSPDVPNGAVAHRLARERQEAVDGLGVQRAETRMARLDGWRYDRQRAAAVRGSYRAATGDLSADAVAADRDRLRSDWLAFLDGHEYRATGPVEAVALHRTVEDLLASTRNSVNSYPSMPSSPVAEPFAAGDVVGNLESGTAALADARILRDRYVERRAGVESHRTALGSVAGWLRYPTLRQRRVVGPLLEEGAAAFDRSLEGTPAEFLLFEAVDTVEENRREVERRVERGDVAGGVVSGATARVAVDALATVADEIDSGAYGVPDSVAPVVDARKRAVSALKRCFAAELLPLSAPVASPAYYALDRGDHGVRHGGDDLARVYALYAYAKNYAVALPSVVEQVTAWLERAG